MNILEEFRDRAAVLKNVNYRDTTGRLIGILQWLEKEPATRQIIDHLKSAINVNALFPNPGERERPRTNTREEIAAVGLHLIEVCRTQEEYFFQLCIAWGIAPDYGSGRFQDFNDTGLRDYVIPFLLYVEKELLKAAEAFSVASVAEGRFANLLTTETSRLLPKTAENLRLISAEFLRPEKEVMWQNVGNSCRQALIEFATEVSVVCNIERPSEIKEGDVRGILKHVLSKMNSGKFKDTLGALSVSIWDHTQSLLHRPATNKQEATRIFLWTGMLVSEFAELARAYNES